MITKWMHWVVKCDICGVGYPTGDQTHDVPWKDIWKEPGWEINTDTGYALCRCCARKRKQKEKGGE